MKKRVEFEFHHFIVTYLERGQIMTRSFPQVIALTEIAEDGDQTVVALTPKTEVATPKLEPIK